MFQENEEVHGAPSVEESYQSGQKEKNNNKSKSERSDLTKSFHSQLITARISLTEWIYLDKLKSHRKHKISPLNDHQVRMQVRVKAAFALPGEGDLW